MAYADYNDLMTLTEDMLSKMVKDITGSFKIKYHPNGTVPNPDEPNKEIKEIEIDFTPPWKRLSMMEELEKRMKVTIPKDIESEEARKFFDE